MTPWSCFWTEKCLVCVTAIKYQLGLQLVSRDAIVRLRSTVGLKLLERDGEREREREREKDREGGREKERDTSPVVPPGPNSHNWPNRFIFIFF